MVGDQREAAIYRNDTKGLLFIDVYMQYIMYVFLNNFRIGLVDSITSQKQHLQEVLVLI